MQVGGENRFAYNAQALSDGKAGVITAAEVVRGETDVGQLAPMIAQGQANVGVAATTTETLADGGYGAGADLDITSRFFFRAQYRGLVYNSPNFDISPISAEILSHRAQPSAGFGFRF